MEINVKLELFITYALLMISSEFALSSEISMEE